MTSTWSRERLEALVEGFMKQIKSMTVAKTEPKTAALKFPEIPKGRPLSPEVMDMVVGKLPEDFDYDKEMDNMYIERAR